MDGGNMYFELAASSSFVSTAFMGTLEISNFIMNCFYVSNKALSSSKRLWALVAQEWLDLENQDTFLYWSLLLLFF